jgi:type VI secretion system secreted protein Hcp
MAFDVFLKIATIDGESTDDKHQGWIELMSYHHGVSQPSAGSPSAGPRGAGRSDHNAFTIVKALDKSSPKLFLACCKGEHINEVTIDLCRATGDKQKYMVYKLSDVMVQSVRPGGSAKDENTVPLEEVSFAYGKIEKEYIETDHKTGKAKGSVKAHWSVVENKGG